MEQEPSIRQVIEHAGQQHLLENIEKFSEEERLQFFSQMNKLNSTYPGGILEYTNRAKELLKNSYEGTNPYADYTPVVPQGETIDFYNQKQIDDLEAIGAQEIPNTCFVLGNKKINSYLIKKVAGGLGERLGYKGIKIGLPIDLVTQTTFFEYYASFIQSYQQKFCDGKLLPFAIMTSDDTHDKTVELLQNNQYFGLSTEQVSLIKQEKVPAMIDNEARFAQLQNSLLIDTKPHGHGDIHTLLYMSGLASKWAQEGRKWVFIFQDTNPLSFRALPSVLGVSKTRSFELNSITVPRKPGEAIGAICELKKQNGESITINVEYNQLEPLLKQFGGEQTDEHGYSKFPGNINGLIFSLPEYNKILQETKGLIAEFINPKYADATKTKFKSSTRLECMMQDYPKLLKAENKVGFTQIDRRFCFTTCKNDIVTAAQKQQQNLAPESAGSCESDFYFVNAELLRMCGAQVEKSDEKDTQQFAGVNYNFFPTVFLHPSFGVTLAEIRKRIQGTVKISNKSTLVLRGEANLQNIDLDGTLKIWGNGNFGQITINDKVYTQFESVDVKSEKTPGFLQIRGYRIVRK